MKVKLYNKKKFNFISGVLTEVIADFFTVYLLGRSINEPIFDYGKAHLCSLKKEFIDDVKEHPKAFGRWLYQGNRSKDRPADLGYYIGYEIAKAYYEQEEDKLVALDNLLNVKMYKKVLKKSGFTNAGCD